MKKMIMAMIICLTAFINAQTVVNLVQNPYGAVNWSTYQQYKGNFHTHSTYSDGSVAFATVVSAYNNANYDILAMTDHNIVTWPWTGGIPAGMLGVRGDEFSNSDHMNGFFNFTLTSATLEQGIPNVQTNNGRSHINHPGRTHAATDWAWFIPWYRDYSTNIGMEVYNQGDRYPTDRALWDNINTNLFPAEDKLVWGFSNDDMHTTADYFHNYQFMLMPTLTQADLTTSMDNGAFYFCYEPSGTGTANVPRISGITVDNTAKTITIAATGYTSISWIGPGTVSVGTGTTFNYSTYTGKAFVRAVLTGSNGTSFTQPFGFETVTTTPPVANFTADNTTVVFGQTVNFTDTSTNGPTSWSWTFDGGVPGTSTAKNPSVVYPNIGTYQVSLIATNVYGSDTETKTGYITVGNTGSVSISVTAGTDDVEETCSTGEMYIDSSDLEFNDDSRDQDVGIRFNGITIPKGATITSAYIQVKAKDNDTAVLNQIKFAGHAYDNSPAFTTAAYNLSSRPKTTNTVTWTNPPSWTANSTYNFPSMVSVVQEIVNRTGWASGNSMSFIFWKDDTDADERNAFAYEGGTAAKLIVGYTIGSAPAVPTLALPANASSTTDLTPTFDWNDVATATSYTIQADNNSDFSSPEITNSPALSTYTPVSNLAIGTYYWRVLATNASGSSAYTASWTVVLGAVPAVPTLTTPTDASLTIDLTPAFEWNDVATATAYTIQIDNDIAFGSADYTNSPATSTYTPGANLPTGTWYWRVLATNAFGSSAYTASWSVVLGAIPAIPTLATPTDASTLYDPTPTFDWNDVTDATAYTILVDDNSDFSSPEITDSPATSTYTAGTLAYGTYYWKVLATNAFGSSVYTTTWSVVLAAVETPTGLTTALVTGNVYINWNDAAGATSYDVYSSVNPYGTFAFLENVVTSEYTYTPTVAKMFFYVIGKNANKETPATIEIVEPVTK